MENLNDLFNLSANDLVHKEENKSSELFKPAADKGKDGVYSAVVRFIPWHKNPKKSIMNKWTSWLVDPLTDKGRYVDCPSSVGQKSIIQDMFWKLRKSDSVAEQNLSKNFSRRQTFASLVQVIKDDNNPDSVGKIMVWSYGVKVHEKIQDVMQPEFGEPHIPFDLFEGKPFHVKVTKVAGFNNYDSCKFLDQEHPISVNGERVERDEEGMKKILEYLQTASPDLEKYDFQEWDEDTTQYVNNVVANTVPGGRMASEVQSDNKKQKSSSAPEVVNDPLGSTTKEDKKESNDSQDLPDLDDGIDDIDDVDMEIDDDLYADL